MKQPLCPGKADTVWESVSWKEWKRLNRGLWDWIHPPRPLDQHHIRMKCKLCGRRVLSSMRFDSDFDYIIHSIPPHKPKGWWKKGKKRENRKSHKHRH